MNEKLEEFAKTETYEDVKRMVFDFVAKACRVNKYLNYADALSWAHEGFMQAYLTYKPERGAFTTWVGFKVQKRILDYARHLAKQTKFCELVEAEQNGRHFDLMEFLTNLSNDAGYVAGLVFMPPPDIVVTAGKDKLEDPEAMKAAIREFLEEANWPAKRIKEAFQEIREAL